MYARRNKTIISGIRAFQFTLDLLNNMSFDFILSLLPHFCSQVALHSMIYFVLGLTVLLLLSNFQPNITLDIRFFIMLKCPSHWNLLAVISVITSLLLYNSCNSRLVSILHVPISFIVHRFSFSKCPHEKLLVLLFIIIY